MAPYVAYDPARDLPQLLHDVQTCRLHADSKTFVDRRPLAPPSEIEARFLEAVRSPAFDRAAFVNRHFSPTLPIVCPEQATGAQTMEQRLDWLWDQLTRQPAPPSGYSSLIPLPHPYVVPGGRFEEIYYWDAYFIMLGLLSSGRTALAKSMLDNMAYLVDTVGHVPNGNRTYYLSRSQPPFLAAMLRLYADRTGVSAALPYLDTLEKEHAFWMDGHAALGPGEAAQRVVKLGDGSLLNRYWDDQAEPRPEAYAEDYCGARGLVGPDLEASYRNRRAAAESGWDFSSRWMRDPKNLRSLETTELIPIDLNSLLCVTEQQIAALRDARGGPGDAEVARHYRAAAESRRRALVGASYDLSEEFFFDVRWRSGERVIDRPTMAAATPLYFGLASEAQGRAVADRMEREFLKPGGFVTTLIPSGQQWDHPNGWPPLQWMAIEGVRRYGRGDLADDATDRWLMLNRRVYDALGKMMEKYDVVDIDRPAGGGEYELQDGFGWTNGVAQALLSNERLR